MIHAIALTKTTALEILSQHPVSLWR